MCMEDFTVFCKLLTTRALLAEFHRCIRTNNTATTLAAFPTKNQLQAGSARLQLPV